MTTSPTRGVDHIGVTVTDIEAATTFFVDAFGGELLYQSHGPSDPVIEGDDLEKLHDMAAGSQLIAQRVIKIADGPDIELFEMRAPVQNGPARSNDLGLTHVAFYVDDIDAAVARFVSAGGIVLSPPNDIGFETEAGEGNRYCYAQTPWGMNVEFITLPGSMGYEQQTSSRRWRRAG
jgi:catechol 2,3-dioxygenase-like lactoylglutathione lyase family enzyme